MLIDEIDLLPHVDFDIAAEISHARRVHPAVHPAIEALPVSARTGEGLAAWYDWLRRHLVAA